VPARGKQGNGTGSAGFEGLLWKAAEVLRGSMDASEYKHVVLGLIFLKYVSEAYEQRRDTLRDELAADGITGAQADKLLESPDRYTERGAFWVPPEARWDYLRGRANLHRIGERIDNAITLIERHNPGLLGILPRTYDRSSLDMRRLAELVDLFSGIGLGVVRLAEKDILGRAYEFFLNWFASSEGKGGGEYYTPRSVVRLLVEMTEPYSGRVYDPCCGTGGMFLLAERFVKAHGGRRDDIAVYGQELNNTTWRLAKMNLAIHGIEANLGPCWGDSFHQDLHHDLKADYVLANPPFNVSGWGADRLPCDPRWRYGVPPAGNANFAWLQHVVGHLSPRGIAAVVLTDRSVSGQQPSEAYIRQRMIEDDLVECIVALPGRLFHSTQVPVTLWLLNRDKTSAGTRHWRDRRGETLFIDARNLGVMIDCTRRTLTDNDLARITGTYHSWRGEPGAGSYVNQSGFCSAATIFEIGEHGYTLTPSPYVAAEDIDEDHERLDKKIVRLTEGLRTVNWPVSRLVDYVKHTEYLRSWKAPERAAKIAEFRDEERLVLPVEDHIDAAYGAVSETIIINRCLLISLMPGMNGFFLAAWLNSDEGRRIRAAAMPGTGRSPRTVSLENRRRFLEGLVVPVPGLDIQAAIADAVLTLTKVPQRAGQLAAELWRMPSLAAEIQPITRHWLDSAGSYIADQ
jgi:type I restriction enzyme M protein